MDSERFDRIARTFSQARSRRQALRGLAAVAAGALALGGREASADECKRTGKACKKHSQCCSGNCARGTCQAEVVCVGGTCEQGFPTCENDLDCHCFQTLDGVGFCRRESSTPCGAACSATQPCAAGEVCLINTCCPTGSSCNPIAQAACSAVTAAATTARGADPMIGRNGQ